MSNQTTGVAQSLLKWADRLSLPALLGGLVAFGVLIVTDHPHRAVLLLVAILSSFAGLRLVLPGRPWFASRGRIFDSAVFLGVALLLWWFSPWTATMGR